MITVSLSVQSGKEKHFGYFRGNVITSTTEEILTEGLKEQKGGGIVIQR